MRRLFRRRGSRGLGAILAAALIVAVVGVGLAVAQQPPPKPERATPPGFVPPPPDANGTPVGRPLSYPQEVTQGRVPVPSPVIYPTPPSYPYAPPDQAVLGAVAALRSAPGGLCPPTYLKHHSVFLEATFCYPPTWKFEGESSQLVALRKMNAAGRELASVFLYTEGRRMTIANCPNPGALPVGPLSAQVCFERPWITPSQLMAVIVPHALPKASELVVGIELQYLADLPKGAVSPQDQREALAIVASLVFDR